MSDCASLVENLHALDPKTTEKRLKIDLIAMRDMLNDKTIRDIVWTDTRIMLADCMTKNMQTDMLEDTIRTGMISCVYKGPKAKKASAKPTLASSVLSMLLALTEDSVDGDSRDAETDWTA